MNNAVNALVSAQWLAENIDNDDLCVLDCTTHMTAQPVGPSRITSGRPDYEKSHIPGALHVDMVQDLSDPNGPFPYTALTTDQFAALRARLGIKPTDHVVIYGQSANTTVTRAWFIFWLNGHERVSVLDGGLHAWLSEGMQTIGGPEVRQPITAQTTVQRPVIATLSDVQEALQTQSCQLINALSAEQFTGSGGAHYGRPGRIPQSISLPARTLYDTRTGKFLTRNQLLGAVNHANIDLTQPIIHYCGGGIAATTSAFITHLLGSANWRVYDNSLLQWCQDAQCPMVTG